MKDFIYLDKKRMNHVLAYDFKIGMIHQVNDVGFIAGEEVVKAQDFVALCKQSFTEMRADKSGSARDQYAFPAQGSPPAA